MTLEPAKTEPYLRVKRTMESIAGRIRKEAEFLNRDEVNPFVILTELECPQVIIVSHERELESFADQIFRVSKEHGISTIAEA